ncbi:MAG TPA: saccharopine dehydrogenase [Verrucomicrobiales bacterium]|jgi:saccharopine dehydrogenase (NAD+, L-lysine-forming)|nr:saccharopine dehydrogenase [Pedosphaera sp.]HBF02318.1 saccharopine dehydrogenase [Verrucomicrobiales bacterium]HCQ85289.1 saccharopine dehydrogenase [Verrucomicrobiales bacterium]
MSRVLIIGAGGVGRVVAHKCAALREVFTDICLASRTLSKAQQIASEVKGEIEIAQLDADRVSDTVALIRSFNADLVIHVALPYQDLAIMDACLEAGVDYLDTANYEPPDQARFEYRWQWDYQQRFQSAGLMALLGSGFDPGVTNVFCAYAQKHLFDEIHEVDILDCNAGDHGHPFATNFNPEINIREVTAPGRYWEQGQWKQTEPLSVSREFDFPEVGLRRAYLMYHEELESLSLHLKGLKRIRFWMTFGEAYLNHLKVLENVGMTGIEPVSFQGQEIIPLQFLKVLLPDPASLGPRTQGQTCIGCLIHGVKEGKPRRIFLYNVCDHQSCYQEVKSQAVSYTTGVPAMIGAKQILTGQWRQPGVFNMEQCDPDPFMNDLNHFGLPWQIKEFGADEELLQH